LAFRTCGCLTILLLPTSLITTAEEGSPTRQHQDGGRPAGGARELLEIRPGVDGVVDQRFAPQAGKVEGPAGDEQAQDVLRLRRAALLVKLDGGPADAVGERHLRNEKRSQQIHFETLNPPPRCIFDFVPVQVSCQRRPYPVLYDAGLLVRVLALDHRVVVRGGARRQALLRLVARRAVRRLVGVEGGGGVLLVEGGDGR